MPTYRQVLLGLGGAGAAYIYFKPRPKPFHIKVDNQPEQLVGGVNIVPIITGIASSLPASWKKKMLVGQSAPDPEKEVRDRFDLTGKSPYTRIEELKEGKVWNITYEMENMLFTDPKALQGFKMLGVDFDSEKFATKVKAGAAKYGEAMERLAEIDIATAKEWAEKAEKGQIPTEDIFKLPPWSLKTVVVRLNSGGLMLFAPAKVQDSKALPRGKFDFLTTDPKDMEVINEIMNKEGVHFHSVAGDAVTEAALVIAHKTILECDLLYGHADREGFTDVKRERFRQMRPEDWFPRLFKFALIDCSPDGGCLPAYRFWLMDPNSLGPMASLKGPAADGSSCKAMAESLRAALDLDFDSAAGVHFEPMTREEFRGAIDCSWKWLDGKSLLKDEDGKSSLKDRDKE